MKKINCVLLTLALGLVLVACISKKDDLNKKGESKMDSIYNEVEFKKLPKMRVAMYRVISQTPEDDVINYMDNWAKESGLLDVADYIPRKFGWDYPHLSEEQKSNNLRGYEFCYTIPENFTPKTEGADILYIESDEYAVIRVTDPFINPFDTIPNGWRKLYEFVNAGEFKTIHWNNRYAMEEVIEINGITYMDIYFPIR